jgi:nucleotide-binding universal stress UspA family protein
MTMPVPVILVPLDGSREAEHAIPAALEVARRTDARLELLRVRPPRAIREEIEGRPFTDPGPPGIERRYLDEIAARLPDAFQLGVKVVLGEPAAAIVNRAADAGARLIVMCTHARGSAGRLLLGSVADAVVRSAAVPVMLLKPPPTQATLPALRPFPRVLIPVDGSRESEQIVPLLVRTIGATGTEFSLLRVVHPEAALVASNAAAGGGRDQNPRRELETLASWIRARDGHAAARLVADRTPASVILEEADRTGARLIAMTTRARRGTSRLVLGSVADEVLRGAGCPVILFRPLTADWGATP